MTTAKVAAKKYRRRLFTLALAIATTGLVQCAGVETKRFLQPLAENGWQSRRAADGVEQAAVYETGTVTLRAEPNPVGTDGVVVVTVIPVPYGDAGSIEIPLEIHSRIDGLVIYTDKIGVVRADTNAPIPHAVECSRSTFEGGKIAAIALPCQPARLDAGETMQLRVRLYARGTDFGAGALRIAPALPPTVSAIPDLRFEIRSKTRPARIASLRAGSDSTA